MLILADTDIHSYMSVMILITMAITFGIGHLVGHSVT